MNALQLKKLSKVRAVHALLCAATETSGIALLPAKLTLLGAKLAEIDALALRQSQPTRGSTARRDACLSEMIEAALEVAGLVQSYAADHRLCDLTAQTRLRQSDFTRTRLVRRPTLAQGIYDAAAPLAAELAPYGVTPAMLADLREKINTAYATVMLPREHVCEKAAATARLAAVLAETDALLCHQIDHLVFLLRRTHPEFYVTYRQLRATRGRWRVLRLAHDGLRAPIPTPPVAIAPTVKWKIVTASPAPIPLESVAPPAPATEARVA